MNYVGPEFKLESLRAVNGEDSGGFTTAALYFSIACRLQPGSWVDFGAPLSSYSAYTHVSKVNNPTRLVKSHRLVWIQLKG